MGKRRSRWTADPVPFRKAYLQALIDVIEVDDHRVRIKGLEDLLEKAVLASERSESWCSYMSTKWRAIATAEAPASPTKADLR